MAHRLVVLISGNGSNLQAILDACNRGDLAARVAAVFANRREAFGLERARRAGVPTGYAPLGPYRQAGRTRQAYDRDLAQRVAAYQPDLVVLAGWMHIFSRAFLDAFPHRVINLHPALPGQFPGVAAIERAYEAFQRGAIQGSGCMVHYAVPEVDAGPVILAESVPILPNDTLETFATRLHAVEHRLIVAAIHIALAEPGSA